MKNVIEIARQLALEGHKDQKRKDGKSYFSHVEAVAEIVKRKGGSDIVVAAAFLHDGLEDVEYTGLTEKDLFDAGLPETVINIVKAVTKSKGENYFDFIMRIRASGPASRLTKLSDLEHNMSDLTEGSLKDKYRFAHYILLH